MKKLEYLQTVQHIRQSDAIGHGGAGLSEVYCILFRLQIVLQ